MKKKYLLILMLPLFYSTTLTAQSFAINTDGSTANASAILDVKSTAKGILIPRMSKTERNSIASPATGLMVFQNSPDSVGFYYYNGSSWSWVSSSSNGGDWKLTGNTGTDTATNFIGTNDNMALRFKINNQQAGLISSNNNLIGLGAGKILGTSTGITAIGVGALGLNQNKNDLVAVGDSALYKNSTGATFASQSVGNSAFGTKALLNNTLGPFNTAIGSQALYSNTIGSGNVATGHTALYSNTTGFANVATGDAALYSNSTGVQNTALGNFSMYYNIDGDNNTAMGHGVLLHNVNGNNNTAVGFFALSQNNSNGNTALGFSAQYNNTTGSLNTSVGNYALLNNSVGSRNTAIGYSTLSKNTGGSYNTGVGDSANVIAGNLSNATAIGAKSQVDCSNCLVLGSVNGTNNATSNVKVGIGTTSPDALLHVQRGAVLFDSTIGTTPVSGVGTRMMWIPAKKAFRAGWIVGAPGTQWDDVNIGDASYAMGVNAIASGYSSFSFGNGTTASGYYSTALGNQTTASGLNVSTAMGILSTATGNFGSTAMGYSAHASGNYAATAIGYGCGASGDSGTVAMGYGSTASGKTSLAAGNFARAYGKYSIALGDSAVSSGIASFATGYHTNAAGNYSVSMGYETDATSIYSTALGYQTTASGGYSIAMGFQSTASGTNAVAIGQYNTAGDHATAIGTTNFTTGSFALSLGNHNTVTSSDAFALGNQNNSRATSSLAMGNFSSTDGIFSMTAGLSTIAKAYGGFVTGMFNDSSLAASSSSANSLNRIFQVGNGTANNARSNAMTILLNGNTGIGVLNPLHNLVVAKSICVDDNDANNGDMTNTLLFGAYYTGEAIGSKRTVGGNHFGLDFYTNYLNRMVVTWTGNVGIGVYSPARLLSVATDIGVDENNANSGTISNSLHFGAGNSGEAIASNRVGGNQWGLDFYTNFVNRLSISNTGNVGIGTTAPSTTLDVNGTTTTNGLQVGNGTVITKMQSGSITVGSNGSGEMVYTFAFPVPFATTTPRVFATARNAPATSFNDAFSVSVRAVTSTLVTLNIQRTDNNTGWGQLLRIDWFAVE